jgi:hypothetical protein
MEQNYFSPIQHESVLRMLEKIKTMSGQIIILSLGVKTLIVNYLRTKHPEIFALVNGSGDIIGSINPQDTVDGNDETWANRKASELRKIRDKDVNKKILFFDDTLLNVQIAQASGFDSYLVVMDRQNQMTNIEAIVNDIIEQKSSNIPTNIV